MKTCLFLCVSMVSLSALGSGLVINDPTQPVYRKAHSPTAKTASSRVEEEINEIPPLVQLIYSKSRKVAVFGDEFYRPGDITRFGTVVAIEKDRVLLENDGIIAPVFMFDPPPFQDDNRVN